MKKIVGILAAAALIATSVFAADVSAQVRIAGDIFSYDGTAVDKKEASAAGSFSILRAANQSQPWWTPYITLSTSTDEAGAQVLFITGDDGKEAVNVARSFVWFKPLDMLTIKAGFQEYMMNQETIDYTSISKAAVDFGYGILYAQDAITVNAFLGTGNNGWLYQDKISKYKTSDDYASAYINDLYVNAAYEADFGTISAMFEFQGKELAEKSSRPDTIRFGAGYKNTIDALTFWADVVGTSYGTYSDKELAKKPTFNDTWGNTNIDGWTDMTRAEKDQALVDAENKFVIFKDKNDPSKARTAFGFVADGYVKYAQDALTVQGYVKYGILDFGNWYLNKDSEKKDSLTANNNMILGLKARVDYKLDNGITLFGAFANDNLLRKQWTDKNKTDNWDNYSSVFVSTIKAGANGSVGILSWETLLKFETGCNVTKIDTTDADKLKNNYKYDKVKVSMPVTLTVAF